MQDGLYTLSEMECMGSCVNAPMIAVADYSGPDVRSFSYTYYEDLTPEDAVSIMEDLKAGKKPRVSASCVIVCWYALCICTWLGVTALMLEYMPDASGCVSVMLECVCKLHVVQSKYLTV